MSIVFLKSTVIILTSNLGSQYLLEGINEAGEITPEAREQINALLKQAFRPEFLNRLDEIVFYKPLTKDNVTHIVDLLLENLNQRLSQRELRCELTAAAKELIIENAYDPLYGARPLRRYLQHTLETLMSRAIIAGEVTEGETVTIDAAEGKLKMVEK